MKRTICRIIAAIGLIGALAVSCEKYDDSGIKDEIKSLDKRISDLEDKVRTANGNIESLSGIIGKSVYVTAVNETSDGYEIVFSNGKKSVISNGKDGKDGENGKDGASPVIGVEKHQGVYYWTINGTWLLDREGNMIPVTGADGKDGAPGQDGAPGKDGQDGAPGKDAVAPQLKIEDGEWFISTDGGSTWTAIGKATGEDGKDGDSMFKEVNFDENFVYFTLMDGETFKLSRGANGVQAIVVIPDYADGSVFADIEDFEIFFNIIPERAAESLDALNLDCFSLKGVYTQTRAGAGQAVDIRLKEKRVLGDWLVVKATAYDMDRSFKTYGQVGLSLFLTIDDGVKAVSSAYFPLVSPGETGSHEYVDLGLPSGLKWATCNVGADKPHYYGYQYAFGEKETKSNYSDDYYKWYDKATYKYTKYRNDWDILSREDDIAASDWGGLWHIPTYDDVRELQNCCSWSWGVLDGIAGVTVTGPNGNSIFLPAAGISHYSTLNDDSGEKGFYYTANASSPSSAYYLWFAEGDYDNISSNYKEYGCSIRPVWGRSSHTVAITLNVHEIKARAGMQVQLCDVSKTPRKLSCSSEDESIATVDENGLVTILKAGYAKIEAYGAGGGHDSCIIYPDPDGYDWTEAEAVDLGLPSGLRWASANLGASKETETGALFAWGETRPKYDYSWDSYKWGDMPSYNNFVINKYNTEDGITELEDADDAAKVLLGNGWRMPNWVEINELYHNCTWEGISIDEVKGVKATGPNGNSIFIPLPQNRYQTSVLHEECVFSWSSSVRIGRQWGSIIPLTESGFYPDMYGLWRCYGAPIRPVIGEGLAPQPPVSNPFASSTSLKMHARGDKSINDCAN